MTYKEYIKGRNLTPLEAKFYSYQQDVESGRIMTNKWVKLAVKRFANDFKRQGTDEFPYIFDFSKAERLLQFGQLLKQVNDNWAGKPLVFLPWQVWTLGNIYGWCHKDTGLRRFRKAWLYVTRKSGKQIDITQGIMTPDRGTVPFGDIHPGDLVFSETGEPVRVKWESEIYTDKDCYEIDFGDGGKIICGADHLWNVSRSQHDWGYKANTWYTLETRKIYELFNKIDPKRHMGAFRLPKGQPLQYPEKDLFEPYLLGLWLGDGTASNPEIAVNDQDFGHIISRITLPFSVRREGNKKCQILGIGVDRSVTGPGRNPFRNFLKEKDLINNKHIPEEYFTGSVEQRLALLQGLNDTDGHIEPRRGTIEFCQKRKELADGYARLLDSLGIIYHRTIKNSHYIKNGQRSRDLPAHRFIYYTDLPVFSLPRHLERLRPLKKGDMLTIKDIRKVDPVPCKCIAVDNPTGLFRVGEHNVVTHNSTMIAVTGLWDLLSTNGAQVCTAANTRDQAKIVFNVIKAMVRQNEVLSKRLKVYESTSTIVNQANFGKLEALSSESSKTGDGRNDSLGIFDECSTTDYGIYKVIESGQGQRPEPLNLLISSGSDKLDSMGKQEYDRACKILQGIIQDETYFTILYCLDEKDSWLDESKYIKAQPSLGVTVKPEFLHNLKVQAQQQPSLQTEFKTKCLGLWCSNEHAWINYKYWQVCKDNASKYKLDLSKPYYANLGIDLSKSGDLTSLSLCCYQEGKYYMRHWLYFPIDSLDERIKSENEMWRKWLDDGLVIGVPGKTIDYDWLLVQIQKICEEYEISEALYDPYSANKITNDLENSLTVVPIPQHLKSLSPFTKAYEKEILDGNIVDGNPVMAWCISNAMVYTDANGNCKVIKNSRMGKDVKDLHVDPVITSLMTVGRIKSLLDAGEIDLRTPEESAKHLEDLLNSLGF